MKATIFLRLSRMVVPVPYRDPDHTIVVEQGKSDSVQKLYQDFVLGKLDPLQIGGSGVYDSDDAQEVDPMNRFGLTLEEATQIADRGYQAADDIKAHAAKTKKDKEAAEVKAKADLQKQVEELKNQVKDKE